MIIANTENPVARHLQQWYRSCTLYKFLL